MKVIKTPGGFTLVELLVSMAIVGILAATFSVVNISKNLARARDTKRQTDLQNLRSALEQYRYDNGKYVNPAAGPATNLSPLVGGYVGTLPTPPSSGETYYYSSPTGTPGNYTLCARLEVTPAVAACNTTSCGSIGNCNYQVNDP